MTENQISHPSCADALATAKARAKRIRYIREQLLNLSRAELCKNSNLVEASLKSWELAMAGGLTEKGAEKLACLFKSFDVHCSPSWLLYAIGHGPIKNPEQSLISEEEEQQIADELLVFRKQARAIDTVIKDDSMLPLLYPGDYVAGIAVDEVAQAINKECILVTANNNVFVRLLKACEQPGLYHLDCLNKDSAMVKHEVQAVQIQLAAPILWIRRKKR